MEKKRKRPLRTPEERARQEYNLELFRQVLAKRMEKDGQPVDEIRRRLGHTPDEIERRVRVFAEALS